MRISGTDLLVCVHKYIRLYSPVTLTYIPQIFKGSFLNDQKRSSLNLQPGPKAALCANLRHIKLNVVLKSSFHVYMLF